MSTLFLHIAFRTQVSLAGLARKLSARVVDDECGQDAIEYIGVLAVVAVVIGVVIAVASGLQGTITSGASKVISEVFSH